MKARARERLIRVHLYLAAFFAPVVLLMAISGAMQLADARGSYTTTVVELPEVGKLDVKSASLKEDVEWILRRAGIDHSFSDIVVARAGQEHVHDGEAGGAEEGEDGHGHGEDAARPEEGEGDHEEGEAHDGEEHGIRETAVEGGMTVTTLPTSRTNYQISIAADGTMELKRREPDLQKRMVELHRGNGPRFFKYFQRVMAVGLLVIVAIGLVMGLTAPHLRKPTMATAAGGLVVFLLLVLIA
ncbi:MAG: hypothetical protein OXG11_06175 [Chloroflexi bacterium]|nr:hypothetical protein [Chloroflexota bacterium]